MLRLIRINHKHQTDPTYPSQSSKPDGKRISANTYKLHLMIEPGAEFTLSLPKGRDAK